MNIVLVHAPLHFATTPRGALETLHNHAPPLGLAYLAAMVRNECRVEIIDAQGMREEQLRSELARRQADLLGISATTAAARNANRIAQLAKEVRADCFTVLGGPHMTATPAETLAAFPAIDAGIVGDGEQSFQQLARARARGREWRELPGMVFRDGAVAVRINAPGNLPPLDDLPLPARDLLPPLTHYSFNPAAYLRKPHTMVIASRGCPFQCMFCHVARFRSAVRFRSPARVVDELAVLTRDYGVREVRFGDELFALDINRAGEICREIRRRKLDLVWSCEARAENLTPAFAATLKAGGCWQVTMGIESGSPAILERLRKQITREQVVTAVRAAHAAGLTVRAFFMLGFPFETREDMQRTISFASSSGVDYASFHYVTPFPGTELYQLCVDAGYFSANGWLELDSTLSRPGCPPRDMTAGEVEMLFKQAYRTFYLRPQCWLNLLSRIRRPEDIRRLLRGAGALLKFNAAR